MRKLLLIAGMVIGVSSIAAADDLDENYSICDGHRIKLPPGMEYLASRNKDIKWDKGWGHCEQVETAYIAREAKRRETDEALNPELKKSRDFVREMQK